jgi:hypothetical protein
MACCGQKRQQIRSQAIPVRRADNPAKIAGAQESSVHRPGIKFQIWNFKMQSGNSIVSSQALIRPGRSKQQFGRAG